MLRSSVSCLEFTAVNYLIFVYLETSISRSDLTFLLSFFFSEHRQKLAEWLIWQL